MATGEIPCTVNDAMSALVVVGYGGGTTCFRIDPSCCSTEFSNYNFLCRGFKASTDSVDSVDSPFVSVGCRGC